MNWRQALRRTVFIFKQPPNQSLVGRYLILIYERAIHTVGTIPFSKFWIIQKKTRRKSVGWLRVLNTSVIWRNVVWMLRGWFQSRHLEAPIPLILQ